MKSGGCVVHSAWSPECEAYSGKCEVWCVDCEADSVFFSIYLNASLSACLLQKMF